MTTSSESSTRTVLSVAGLDPCGGAGVIADIRTFDALRTYGMGVATTLTYQSTLGMRGRYDVPADAVRRQLEEILADRPPHAVKLGALGNAETADVIASFLQGIPDCPLVVDPVLSSSDGEPLVTERVLEVLDKRIFGLATLITPNVGELERLAGARIGDIADVEGAVMRIKGHGNGAVLVTGFREDGEPKRSVDLLFAEGRQEMYSMPWREGLDVHGTGCVLSAAIAALLARGQSLTDAIEASRELVAAAIDKSIRPGRGRPCANPAAGARKNEGRLP